MGTKNRYTTPIVRSTASSDESESDDDDIDVHRVERQRWARAYQSVGGNVQFVDEGGEWIACAPDDLVEVRE